MARDRNQACGQAIERKRRTEPRRKRHNQAAVAPPAQAGRRLPAGALEIGMAPGGHCRGGVERTECRYGATVARRLWARGIGDRRQSKRNQQASEADQAPH